MNLAARLARPLVSRALPALLLAAATLVPCAPDASAGDDRPLQRTCDELIARRDGPLSGEDLTGAEKKQLKAVNKALDVFTELESGPYTLRDEIKAMKKLASKLKRPFKSEFDERATGQDFGALLLNAAMAFGGEVTSARDDVQARLPTNKATPKQAQAKIDGATKKLTKASEATKVAKKAKLLLAALKKIAQANKILDKVDAGGGDSLSVSIERAGGTTPWTASTVMAEYNETSGELQIFATGPRSVGDTIEYTLFFTAQAVFDEGGFSVGSGAGEFQIADTTLPLVQRLTHRYVVQAGTVTVETLNTGAPRVAGSFELGAALDSNSEDTASLTGGTFSTGEVDLR